MKEGRALAQTSVIDSGSAKERGEQHRIVGRAQLFNFSEGGLNPGEGWEPLNLPQPQGMFILCSSEGLLFFLSLSGNKTLSNREVGATHGMCAHTRGQLCRLSGPMSAASPLVDDLWPRRKLQDVYSSFLGKCASDPAPAPHTVVCMRLSFL